MPAKVFFSRKYYLQNSFADLLQSSDDFIEQRAVVLVIAAVDIAHPPITIDDERGRVRDVNGIGAECVMEPGFPGHGSCLIEQKDAGDGMLLQKSSRPPHAVPLFGGKEHQLGSRRFDFRPSRLELSHALYAVWSPGTAQKLENQRALGKQTIESEQALAIGRSQRKIWGE